MGYDGEDEEPLQQKLKLLFDVFWSIELHANPERGGFAFIENGKEVNFQSAWRRKRSDRLKDYLRRSKGTLESREPK
jgi:hypothetical protein